jgi:hypothetical protein
VYREYKYPKKKKVWYGHEHVVDIHGGGFFKSMYVKISKRKAKNEK